MIDSDFSSSANDSTNNHTNTHKRSFVDAPSAEPSRHSSSKKYRTSLGNQVGIVVELKHFEVPLVSATDGSGSGCESIHLQVDWPYTIGRSARHCEFVFHERRVSKQHCQLLFDGSRQKLYILDGVLGVNDSTRFVNYSTRFIVREFRNRLMTFHGNDIEVPKGVRFQASSNGVFVNGVKIRKGMAVELSDGNKVLLVCGHENGSCNIQHRIGFVIQRIVSLENGFEKCDNYAIERMHKLDAVTFSRYSHGLPPIRKRNKRDFAMRENGLYRSTFFKTKYERLLGRASFLLDRCREILFSNDPVPYILHAISDIRGKYTLVTSLNNFSGTNSVNSIRLLVDREEQSQYIKTILGQELPLQANLSVDLQMENKSTGIVRSTSAKLDGTEIIYLVADSYHHQHLCQEGNVEVALENDIFVKNPNGNFLNSFWKDNHPLGGNEQEKHGGIFYSSPGKNFFLNRLEFANYGSSVLDNAISLPELLYPVQSITRMFIATFTSEIKWFLSYCKIPCHLPVTIACHNIERCWSSRPHERIDVPYPDYPNLVVVYPPFPETIAFSNNLKKRGIACHHPKLLVLQREDSIRVVITSANLVEKQWNSVTNTIWWQDFPRVSSADYASLFPKNLDGDMNPDSECDFAAYLSGFMASLLINIPDQAHWIIDLTKYDFRGATGHLIASVPGIHCYQSFVMPESLNSSPFLGSVAASVAGLSHLFHAAADSNGTRLKRLATFLGKSCGNAHGKLEIVLRRNPDVPTDSNSVSILVPSPNGTSEGDYVQIGFLPRNVAKWVSPLWDVGFFKFSGYVCPKEVLAAALRENCKKVQLVLYVSRGQHFQDISKMMQPERMVAFCSLIASTQRCYGVWRLQEVLNRYKWPETLQSDIIYSSSSIGSSVNPQFLAAFSAAVGRKSLQCFDSEESDPEWGYWNANEELKNPSIKIHFPTIERVKNAYNGILPSQRILCFSESAWQRLKSLDILHDAIPHPRDRVGHPMHVKVVRRRFSSGRNARSTGWVYCGSHNFSAAAWGRQISNPYGIKADGPRKGSASLDSGLHICNYELGIVFTFPPTENNDSPRVKSTNLDDIILPFVVPAPKYGSQDKPATMQAMREAMSELNEQQSEKHAEEEMMEEILEEEEEMETINCAAEEQEEEKAYAEMLWSQVDLSQSC